MTSDEPEEGPTPRIVEAVGLATAKATATAVARVRRAFSIRHLRAAEHFASELQRHEAEYSGAGWGEHFDFCCWNASAAIILSFSAIEAAIDEAEDDLGLPTALSLAFDRSPTLDHVQALLAHRGCATFDKGTSPLQEAELLRALRNGLVHPKAEWDDDREVGERLNRKILGAGLPLSPFETDPNVAFPNGCMSAGVAIWAASTARKFIRELRTRLGLAPGL